MFDLSKTLQLVLGALTRPAETWESWLAENPDWQITAVRLAGPILLVYALLGVIFSRLMGNSFMMAGMNVLEAIFFTLLTSAAVMAILTLTASYLAGVMGGKRDHERAFAAVAIVSVPIFAASIVGALIPWFGPLIGLAGAILGLIFLYRILPLALGIPEGQRIKHFAVTLLATFIINALVVMILMPRSAFMPGV